MQKPETFSLNISYSLTLCSIPNDNTHTQILNFPIKNNSGSSRLETFLSRKDSLTFQVQIPYQLSSPFQRKSGCAPTSFSRWPQGAGGNFLSCWHPAHMLSRVLYWGVSGLLWTPISYPSVHCRGWGLAVFWGATLPARAGVLGLWPSSTASLVPIPDSSLFLTPSACLYSHAGPCKCQIP